MNLVTNHFSIKFLGKSINGYVLSIDIEPEIEKDARFLLRKIIENVKKDITKEFGYYAHRGWSIYTFQGTDNQVTFKSNYKNTDYTIRLK